MSEREPGAELHEVVHQRVRLGILAVLSRRGRASFTELRQALGQSDGALSRHLGVLEKHSLVDTEKVFENRRPRTWVQMTDSGRAAFREEQAQLAELLASASSETSGSRAGEGDDQTVAMAVVFAALLDGDGTPAQERDSGIVGEGGYSALLPASPTIPGLNPMATASGPISSRYDFPATHAPFGPEQREQRLMFMSHGLRGGWVTTWSDEADDGAWTIAAQAMVVQLGAASDCEAVVRIMSAPTLPLEGDDDVRAYLIPAAAADASTTAVAWFFIGRYLASLVAIGAEHDAVAALATLVTDTRRLLIANES